VLLKMISGRNYTIHLDARSEAEAELALFLQDPEGYRTRGEAQKIKNESAVYMSPGALPQRPVGKTSVIQWYFNGATAGHARQ
jgi:hypothetical protein